MQRSTENLWDRSLYSAGTDSPAKQKEQPRRRRLDTQDEDDTAPGTSSSSPTPRRRLCSLLDFAKPPTSPESPRGKRLPQQTRKCRSLSPVREDDDDEATQLYVRPFPDRRSRTAERRRAAAKLPTTFHDEEDEVEQRPPKNKRPLQGPPTAKNRRTRDVQETKSSDSDDEDQEPIRKTTADPKPPQPKHGKRPPTVVSSESDLDDDQLGITPGHRLKAPSTGATGTRTLQPRLPKLRGLLRPKATPHMQQPNPRNSREIPSGQNLRSSHKRKRRRRRNREEGWKTLSKSRTNCTRT